MMARILQEKRLAEKQRDHVDRRRSQQAQIGMIPPSPALVRHGSKHGAKVPAALTPGQLTPHSVQAQVPIVNNQRSPGITHPYAAAGIGLGHEYSQHQDHFKNAPLAQSQPYGRQSPMVPSFAGQSPVLGGVRVAENTGGIGQDYQHADPPPKPFLLRILTCRC